MKTNIFQVQDKVIKALKDERIPFIIYGGSTILRNKAVSIDDIDILVKLDDWKSGKIDNIMKRLGSPDYIPFVFEKKFKLNDVPIEIKWQTHPVICENVKEIWQMRFKYIDINGVQVKTFDDLFNSLFMCIHAHKHIISGTNKIRNLEDIKVFIETNRIDIDLLDHFAQLKRREKIVRKILALVRDLYGLNIPNWKHNYKREDILYPERHSMPVDKITLEYLRPKDRLWYRQILRHPDPRLYPRITGYGGVI